MIQERRELLKKALYIAPVILTAAVKPAYARGKYSDRGDDDDDGNQGSHRSGGGDDDGDRRRSRGGDDDD